MKNIILATLGLILSSVGFAATETGKVMNDFDDGFHRCVIFNQGGSGLNIGYRCDRPDPDPKPRVVNCTSNPCTVDQTIGQIETEFEFDVTPQAPVEGANFLQIN